MSHAIPRDAGLAGVPVLGNGTHNLSASRIRVISSDADALNGPTDLAFNPEAPDQLWVTNHTDHAMVIFTSTGTPDQTSSRLAGDGTDGQHFLAKPSGLAFGATGRLATSPDENQVTQPMTPTSFMGPTLWSSDLTIFDGGIASHYGMLHDSPLSAGIAWDHDNVYWVFDGTHRGLARYDFHEGHELGGSDHSNGEVARYAAGQVAYVPGIPSHLKIDHTTGLLYVADTGNHRVAVLDTATGTRGGAIGPNYDGDVQYRMTGSMFSTLVDGTTMGLQHPSGLVLHGPMLFVTDNATSRIYAFDLHGRTLDWLDLGAEVPPGGLMGITFDATDNLFLVDHVGNRVLELVSSGS